jgi:predicted amidohydrolase YtcJ
MWTPFKSLADAGIPIVIASDGGPGDSDANPFLNIQLATTHPSNPKEAISREQALIAYTRTAAYSEFVDDQLGMLEAGKLADLAVLSQDIFKVPNEELPKTESVLTIVAGRIAYAREAMWTTAFSRQSNTASRMGRDQNAAAQLFDCTDEVLVK